MHDNRRVLVALLVVTVAAGVFAVVQGIAVNLAQGVLPAGWTWTRSPWFVVGTLATSIVALAVLLSWRSAIERSASRMADRRALVIEADVPLQTGMHLHPARDSIIRWMPRFKLAYTGTRPLCIEDLRLEPVRRETQDGDTVQLVRRERSSYFTAHPTYGALAKKHDAPDTQEDESDEEWPLVLRPGSRIRIGNDQDFQLLINGVPQRLGSDHQLLSYLGPYFDLEPDDDGGYYMGESVIPVNVVCSDDEWETPVAFPIMPVGCRIIIPDIREIDPHDLT
jgi:hypothetical protein